VSKLSHIDDSGGARMVDVGEKQPTRRRARAQAFVRMSDEALRAVRENRLKKGGVVEVARIAAMMGAKRTHDLIPLCHPLPVEVVEAEVELLDGGVRIEVEVRGTAKTGFEMEALVGASIGALTIYDKRKAVDREAVIERVVLIEKSGRKSGRFRRSHEGS